MGPLTRSEHWASGPRVALAGALLVALACGSEDGAAVTATVTVEPPTLLAVAHPALLVPGSVLQVATRGLGEGAAATLELAASPGDSPLLLPERPELADGTTRRFELTDAAAGSLGPGVHTVSLRLRLDAAEGVPAVSAWVRETLELRDTLDAVLDAAPDGTVHREARLVVRAQGLLSALEGQSELLLDGNFTPTTGSAAAVAAALPLALVEPLDRSRAELRVTTELGGVSPGAFDGQARLRLRFRGGAQRVSEPLPCHLEIPPPAVFGLGTASAALGQLVRVDGAGLLGRADRPGEATLLRFDGEVTDADGQAHTLSGAELVLADVSGSSGRFPVAFAAEDAYLVASFFGVSSGRFDGTVTPKVLRGTEEAEGAPATVSLALVGVHQWVVVEWLPGFYDSLPYFGLGLAREAVEEGVLARLQSLYAPYALSFHRAPPDDVLPAAVARIELGGADPTGVGVFGFDNTPGKDVWNLRLGDTIGGANAEVQADGEPGYGGVFVESMLWWSSHPGLPVARPSTAPAPDPLFDEVFDPVRAAPATLAELAGQGDPARVAAVARALAAFTAIVGETAGHELGHSLGLAEPYAGPAVFHRQSPAPGCLMDAGSERPFGERAALPGFEATRLCPESHEYLSEILPRG